MFNGLSKLQLRWGLGGFLLSPLLPLLYFQGQKLLRHFERNPVLPPSGETEGVAGSGDESLHLLVLGESTVEGIGAATMQETISPQLAATLAASSGMKIHWKAMGKSGATAAYTLHKQLPALQTPHAYDVVVILLGANDSFALTSPRKWTKLLQAISKKISARNPESILYLASLPPVGNFPALPQPTRWVLGLCNGLLCHASRLLANSNPRIRYSRGLFENRKHLLSADGIHPSAEGYAQWAAVIASELLPEISSRMAAPAPYLQLKQA